MTAGHVAPLSRTTTVTRVADAIRAGVRNGEYAPGQRLVEADLTRELRVSRGPLREALGRLAAEGIVQIEPHRGAFVRRFDAADVIALFEVREVLEGQAARLAALRIGDGDNRERMLAAAEAIRAHRDRDDYVGYSNENARYHDLIVEIAANPLLRQLLGQLQTQVFRLQFRNLLGAGAKQLSIDEHLEVADAICSGDAAAAERLMREHVRRSGDRSVELARGVTEGP